MSAHATTTPAVPTNTGDEIFDAVFQRSSDFRIELKYEDLLAFIRRIDQYNDFEAGAVIDALEAIDRLIPRSFYGEGNPNNGRRAYRVSVGRESSPVIYLDRLELSFTQPLAEETMKIICREMELCGRADEADYKVQQVSCGGRRIRFRFWWD
jgi:hypothetical protein